ncbi:hypothetical protein J4412_03030 [Candidatus Pacearchaeota archaeon]|nr:hypothetical protein [Candidatus Pacearchaeota archaeon]
MNKFFILFLFMILNLSFVYAQTASLLTNEDAIFQIDDETGLLIGIIDKNLGTNFLNKPSGFAYFTNEIWHEDYNKPSESKAELIKKTDKEIIFFKDEGAFSIQYIYQITDTNLHWTTEILYNGNEVITDLETRIVFRLNESVVKNYDVSPLIKIIGDYDKIEVSAKRYSEIENEGVALNQFLGGPDYIYLNKTNSGILIMNNEPRAGNVGFSIYKEADVPLSYFSNILYFDSKNNKQTIKLTISLDKELSVAKKKAFDYVSSSPLAIDGKWYITFPRNISDEEIATLKSNNYKFIQIHGWAPNYGVYSSSGNWTDYYGNPLDVEKLNNLIRRFQDNGMTVFLYFNAAEMQHDQALKLYKDYIMIDEQGNYSKGYWTEGIPYDQLYIMSLREGAWKEHILQDLSGILNTYEANGIFLDRNDYQNFPDYNPNSPKHYFNKRINKPFDDQNYNAFIKEAINLIHSKGKYVILNLPLSMNYFPEADGISSDFFYLEIVKYLYSSSLGKTLYILPINFKTFQTDYYTNRLEITNFLKSPHVYGGSFSPFILDDNMNYIEIQLDDQKELKNGLSNEIIVNETIYPPEENYTFNQKLDLNNEPSKMEKPRNDFLIATIIGGILILSLIIKIFLSRKEVA